MSRYTDDVASISKETDLLELLTKIKEEFKFAKAFKFMTDELRIQFLKSLNIDIDEFEKRYYFYDSKRSLHISESENHYFWISTIGVVGKSDSKNKYFSALMSQEIVISLLFKEAIRLCDEDSIYDIDSYNFDYLSNFSPALFHNVLFYFELFGKTYLSLNNAIIPKNHDLLEIYSKVREKMFELNQNDTIFHAYVITAFDDLVKHISTIPGKFKEHFVKYRDNEGDATAVIFEKDKMENMKQTLVLSYDFICSYYYNIEDAMYLKNGLFDRLMAKAKNDEEKKAIKMKHSYLLE